MPEADGVYLATPIIYNSNFLFASTVSENFESRYNKQLDHNGANGYDFIKILGGLLQDEELTRDNVKRILDASETMHSSQSELATLEIPDEQRGFTTELSGKISGSIITVVPDKFIEMIQSFSVDTVGIGGTDDLLEFFNVLNGAVLSAIGNFLKVQIKSNPVRPFDSQRDKEVKDMDLMEINYTFELGDRNTWFTIYLWMNILPSFRNKSDDLIF